MEKTFTAKIEETNLEGNGIVKIDGCVVFVLGAVKGDVVRAEITTEKKNFKIAKITEIIEKSPYRAETDCTVFEECGGCTLRHISYEHELEVKKSGIEAALRRQGFRDVKVDEILHGNDKKYRNKAVIRFCNNGWGFCEEGTNNVVSTLSCGICPDSFEKIAAFTFENLKNNLPKYLFLRTNSASSEITCVIGTEKKEVYAEFAGSLMDNFPAVVGVVAKSGDVPEEGEATVIAGRDFINESFLDMNLTVSADSFFQVNHTMAEALCRRAAEYAVPNGSGFGADLYCGTGIIGLSVAKLYPEVFITGVEINKKAVEDAKKNAAINSLHNIGFFCGDSADFAKSVYGSLDFVTIDPPRRGCSEKMIKELLRLKAERITYISCEPTTLARDLKLLCEKHYKIDSVTAVDLFPRTKHVESVVLLNKVQNPITYLNPQ